MKCRSLALAVALLMVTVAPAAAVQPDEVLKDPALEARARALSEGFRCLVCQNQSIDESDAGLARDLRLLIRERLTKGETDQQVTQFVVDRYGDFVLLKPRFTANTLVLWLLPFAIVALGLVYLMRFRARAQSGTAEAELTKDEQKRLRKLRQD